MIHDFEAWSTPRREINTFSDLAGAAVAIEADFYLDRLLNTPPSKEPLLSALGGLPFGLAKQIKTELQALAAADITPIFIFRGLGTTSQSAKFKEASDVAIANADAWELYNQHQAERAVDTFGNSGGSVIQLVSHHAEDCRIRAASSVLQTLAVCLARGKGGLSSRPL